MSGYGLKVADIIAKQAARRKSERVVLHVDPSPATRRRRAALEGSLSAWVRAFGGAAFDSPFSADHDRVLAKISASVNDGGLFALAMPRGHGKSTLLKWSALYVLLTGRRKYVVMVAATAELAQAIVEFVRQQITENDELHKHYPHVTTYARATDGKAIKARYQLRADGKTSGILWSKTTLVFPDVLNAKGEAYASNGAILEAHGLTGAIRGKWRDSKTGKVMRPDFAILDDPQDRESAESPSQCAVRERIITGDVLGLAGPRRRIAAVMCCTVIRKGDLADRFLDHKMHPEWQGETCRLVNKWPDAQETLWSEYARVFRAEPEDGGGASAAAEFYRANKAAMDAGADVSWEYRVRTGELSALHTAENLLLESGPQFWAEYQNQPIDEVSETRPYELREEMVVRRVAERNVYERPAWVTHVIASTDVNPSYALSTVVLGFGRDQTAAVLWYGIHAMSIPGGVPGPVLTNGLCQSLALHGRELAAMPCRIEQWAIDAGGANFTGVLQWCPNSSRSCGIPAMGFTGRGTKNYRPSGRTLDGKPGDGWHKCVDNPYGYVRHWVAWHADYWREISQRAWLGEASAPGAVTLPRGRHDEFARQVCSEILAWKGDQGGVTGWRWVTIPGRHDFGDAMAQGYAAVASLGIGTGGARPVVRRETRKCKVAQEV